MLGAYLTNWLVVFLYCPLFCLLASWMDKGLFCWLPKIDALLADGWLAENQDCLHSCLAGWIADCIGNWQDLRLDWLQTGLTVLLTSSASSTWWLAF